MKRLKKALSILLLMLSSCATYKSNKKFTVIKKLKYGANKRHVGDLYLAHKKNQPIVFTVHGGGWSGRSLSDMDNIAKSLASHGFNVFNINYRLAPKYKHPAPVEDLKLAVEFAKKNYADTMNFGRIGMWGYSSGAHTVMLYSFLHNHGVKAIVAGGGPYDLTWWPKSPIVTPYMGYKHDYNIKGWMDASPVNHLSKDLPALFLYHGEKDRLVQYQQMTAFESMAKYLGATIETYGVGFWGHFGTFLFSKEAVKKGVLFLQKNL